MKLKNAHGECIVGIDPALILPNPAQPRSDFDDTAMQSLADSVRTYGILQPLTVRARRTGGVTFYELVAGERRMRAGVLAGLRELPCRVIEANGEQSAEIAIVENLQRKDLNPFEEATAIERLLHLHGITQEQLAAKLSVSQSYVANKLRLLKFTEEERRRILAAALTERHARALLRLPTCEDRESVLSSVILKNCNVSQTEALVEAALLKAEKKQKKRKVKGAIKDLRLFYNSLDRALGIMRGAGMSADCKRRETDNGVEVTILIQRKNA